MKRLSRPWLTASSATGPVSARRFGLALAACGLLASACVGTVGENPAAPATPGSNPTPGSNNPGSPSTPGGGNDPGNMGPGNTGPGNMGGSGPGAAPIVAGRVSLRRLTRTQFNNTVRDLLGFEGEHGAGFPEDEDASGFRANTSVPVSAAQVDKYEEAADRLGAKVAGEAADRLAPCLAPRQEADCATDFVRGFGKRAFRRPLSDEEVARYKTVFDAGRKADNTYAAGVGLAVAAILQSPNFLYLPELGEGAAAAAGVPLSGYEMAARLSYFLTDSMPDAELFAAAEGNRLRSTDDVIAHAKRLLASPRARDVSINFFKQWLEIEAIASMDKDTKAYPAFSPALREAMAAEINAFIGHVFGAEGGKLGPIMTANYGFVQGPLAELYGTPGTGRVDQPAGQRAGLMTLPGVMALYAHPDQSAPVSRGYLISDKFLCDTPPPAPNDIDVTVPKPDPNRTTRERFSAHRENPACKSCHELMDPYGLTFENFDGIGRWRDREGNKAVDATYDTPRFGMVKNAVELMGKLAASKDVANCFARQWFRLAFGRMDIAGDKPTIDHAQAAFEKGGLAIPDLVTAIASSPAFRHRVAR